jgi:hypothetical protein
MKKPEIDAVDLVRRIRDEHQKILEGRDPEERRSFYQEKARELHDRLRRTSLVREDKTDAAN